MTPSIYIGLDPKTRYSYLNRSKGPIINIVCEETSVSIEKINSKSRKYKTVLARGLISHFARKHTKLTLTEIGQLIGGRDHATVLYHTDQYESRYKNEPTFRMYAEKVELAIKKTIKW